MVFKPWVWGVVLKAEGLGGFRGQGLPFGVSGVGLRVWG